MIADRSVSTDGHKINADNKNRIFSRHRLKERTATYPFTAIQFRIAKDGVGVGKLSAWSIVVEKDAGIALADYDKEPTLLTSVRRSKTS